MTMQGAERPEGCGIGRSSMATTVPEDEAWTGRRHIALGLGEHLSLEDSVAYLDDGAGLGTDVLLQRYDQELGAGGRGDLCLVGQGLLIRDMDAAVELPKPALREYGLCGLHLVWTF